MAHGYLGDGYRTGGEFDRNRDDESERRWRGRRDDWRDRDRDRGMMFEGRETPARERGYGEFQDDYAGAREQHGYGDYSRGRRSYSANPDDHYRSWRDRHLSELDREYEEYCREREEQFHRDFGNWRRRRHGNPQPLRTGMTETGLSADPSGVTQAESETAPSTPSEPDPMATATLGSQSGGRGRR